MNMKTRILTMLAALLLISIGAFAQQVSESGGSRRAPRKMQRVPKAAENDAFYIFNAEDNGGFVIVSGDERTDEILGYSTEGNIDLDKMPENMKALLKSYEEQINAIPADAKAELAMKPSRPAIAPMLDTFWGQGEPYNLHCPEIDGQRCVTGCVATALAQIMYYHKWPEGYTTDIPAYDYTLQSWNNESQSWDNPTAEALPATQFDWNKMNTVYFPNSSEESKEAVSKLMRYCGQAFWMEYGINGSAANLGWFPVLQHYFGYSDKVRFASFSNYSPTEWDQLIYHELQCHRPVIYSSYGSCSSFFKNHAFVCDGYDGSGYYHMNLGWEGNYNGWYLLRVLHGTHDLDIVGLGYLEQTQMDYQFAEAIVGIQKPDEDATLPLTLTATVSLKYDGNDKAFKMDFNNLSDIDRQFECGFRCYNTTNGSIEFEHIGEMFLPSGHSASSAIPVTVCNFVEGIRYRLCPVWREKGEENWHVVDAQSIKIMVSNGNIIEFDNNNLSADINLIGQLVEGNDNNAIITLTNDNEFDLKENVYIDIINKSIGYPTQQGRYYSCLASGEQCMIRVVLSNYNEGDYEIVVKMKNANIASKDFHISKKMNITFSENESPVFDWKSKSFKVLVENNDNERVYDKAVWAYVAPKTIYFEQPISVSSPYFKDCQIIKSERLHIEPGESAWVTIPCGDVNIDLLSSAEFVVCQNQDEERYESGCDGSGDSEVWYWKYGKYYVTDENLNDMGEYYYKYLKVYDEFDYYDSGYYILCYVIDDVSNICVAHQIVGSGDRVFVPGKVKHPWNGKLYSVIGLNDRNYIYNAKSVVIGENITSLPGDRYSNTFGSYNEQLESLTLPASLNHLTNTTLSLAAFPNLKRIYCKSPIPPIIESNDGGNNIHGILYEGIAQITNHPSGEVSIPCKADYSNITLYVPVGSRDAYVKEWGSFINIIEMDVEDMPSTTVELPGDVTGDEIVNDADVAFIIEKMKNAGGEQLGTGTMYYWYVGTNLPAESDKVFEPTIPTLPVSESELATGNHEGWRRIGTTIPKGVIYNTQYDAQSGAIMFNKSGYYYLIIPNGIKVQLGGADILSALFETEEKYSDEAYKPDSKTIPGYTIYYSRGAGGCFTGKIVNP